MNNYGFIVSFQVVIRGVLMGTGDNGSTAVRRSGSIRNDGVSSRWLPTGSTKTMPRRAFRRDGRLLVRCFQRSTNHASASRLFTRLSRRPGWLHINRPNPKCFFFHAIQNHVTEVFCVGFQQELCTERDSTWSEVETKTRLKRLWLKIGRQEMKAISTFQRLQYPIETRIKRRKSNRMELKNRTVHLWLWSRIFKEGRIFIRNRAGELV